MREDEDQFRHYVPLLRRIVILVAVVTAIPVILWTITAFVRTYVAPPKVPVFRPMMATAPIPGPTAASPDGNGRPLAAAPQGAMPQSASAMVEARATTTDARDAPAAPKGPLLADRLADFNANNANATASVPKVADLTTAGPADAVPKAADSMTPPPAAPATPDAPAPSAAAVAAPPQPPAAMNTPTDALPAAAPLTGPIPLPRHRPRELSMAQLGVPMPRPRPGSLGENAPGTTSTPLDWIRSIFQPPQSQQSQQ